MTLHTCINGIQSSFPLNEPGIVWYSMVWYVSARKFQ